MEEQEQIVVSADQAESLETGAATVDTDHTAEEREVFDETSVVGEVGSDGAESECEPVVRTENEGETETDVPPSGEDVSGTALRLAIEPMDWNELCAAYPDVDPALVEQDAAVGAFLRGEAHLTPRQAYEITHMDAIVEARVAERVAEQLSHAVRESEARLLAHIRACGQRPVENGVHAAVGVRMHPAVGRLTRSDRAALARRAQRGETIRL